MLGQILTDTIKYTLPPAVMVGVAVGISVSSDDMWKTIVGTVFVGAIFYVLYSVLDRNPASEDAEFE